MLRSLPLLSLIELQKHWLAIPFKQNHIYLRISPTNGSPMSTEATSDVEGGKQKRTAIVEN
jgi:hypothetical protein